MLPSRPAGSDPPAVVVIMNPKKLFVLLAVAAATAAPAGELLFRDDFDHTKFPGYGNRPFLAFADYALAAGPTWPARCWRQNLISS